MDQQNLDKAFRASELIFAYLESELSDDEQQELDSWIEESTANRELFTHLTNPVSLNEDIGKFYDLEMQKKAALRKIKRKLFVRKVKVFGFVPLIVIRYVAAAAFLGAVVTGVYLSTRKGIPEQSAASQTNKTQQDIAPGDGNQVMLTLADGTTIPLDNSGTGLLAEQNGTEILKQKDGQVIYQADKSNPGEAAMNSIATPKGRQHELILPDGSRVWLNALSKIDFPTAFTGRQRNVSLSGEAFFEVVKDKSKPFNVNVDGMAVRVTGTQFNINSYKDETVVKSTLFEGGVKVTKDEVTVHLAPGQQLQMDPKTKQFKVVNKADLEATSAWRDGVFYLNNIDVMTLMRQASRWYDIEVEYPQGIPSVTLFGEIDRNTNLSELIKVLNESGIKTRLDGKTLQIFQ